MPAPRTGKEASTSICERVKANQLVAASAISTVRPVASATRTEASRAAASATVSVAVTKAMSSAPAAQSGRVSAPPAIICSSAWACTSTPGTADSSGVARRSNRPGALVPISTMRPSSAPAGMVPSSTCHAGT